MAGAQGKQGGPYYKHDPKHCRAGVVLESMTLWRDALLNL